MKRKQSSGMSDRPKSGRDRSAGVFLGIVSVAVVMIVASGILHGLETDRWGVPADVEQAAARLKELPALVGDWHSEAVEVTERELDAAEALGHFSRRYINRQTGAAVSVLVLCGRPGPIACHPPTICFTANGFELQAAPEKHSVKSSGARGEFWSAHFVKNDASRPLHLLTFWGWAAHGEFTAPERPRFEFVHAPQLYKMYVTSESEGPPEAADIATQDDFLRVFLPEVKRELSAGDPARRSAT